MPRSVQDIINQADELAKQLEEGGPGEGTSMDARALRDVREAFIEKAHAEERLAERVRVAKAEGHTWGAIGTMVGTTGEGARQRYGQRSRNEETDITATAARGVDHTRRKVQGKPVRKVTKIGRSSNRASVAKTKR